MRVPVLTINPSLRTGSVGVDIGFVQKEVPAALVGGQAALVDEAVHRTHIDAQEMVCLPGGEPPPFGTLRIFHST